MLRTIMSVLPIDRRQDAAPFGRRGRRGLGWGYLDCLQARALAAALADHSSALVLPPPLEPLAPPARRRFGPLVFLKRLVLVLVAAQLCYMAATSLLIAAYRFTDPSATVLMAVRAWKYGWKLERPRPLPLRRVPVYVRSMLIAIEDDKFYQHHGVDLEAFKRAREINARLGKPLYGGSTLTMQVARTLFLIPVKSYLRKYLEVITAFELELILPKNRILELYFGYAEWGKGIFGIEAASRHWYGAGVASIPRDDAARLVALLSSPIRFRPETLERSLILRERYDYLDRHFVHRPEPTDESASALTASTATAGENAAAPDAAAAPVGGGAALAAPSGAAAPSDAAPAASATTSSAAVGAAASATDQPAPLSPEPDLDPEQ